MTIMIHAKWKRLQKIHFFYFFFQELHPFLIEFVEFIPILKNIVSLRNSNVIAGWGVSLWQERPPGRDQEVAPTSSPQLMRNYILEMVLVVFLRFLHFFSKVFSILSWYGFVKV